MSQSRRYPNVLALGILTAAALPVPLVLSTHHLEVATRVLLFAVLGVAWNVMGGYAGQFSFGHAAFFGIGAYTSAYLLVNHGVSPWVGMLAGALLGATFAVATGYLAFRYKLWHAYFALATFAFANMLLLITLKLGLVNGALGLQVPRLAGSSWGMIQFPPGSANYFYVALALLVAGLAVVIQFLRSRAGLYIIAVRDDREAAEALGVNALQHTLIAAAISGALTAVGGAFFFQFVFFIDPSVAFGSAVSVQIFLPAVIGGIGTLWGPVVGSITVVLMGEISTSLLRNPPTVVSFLEGRSGLNLLLFGATIILVITFLPRGIVGAIRARYR